MDNIKLCCIFSYSIAEEAAKNLDFEIVEKYGDTFYNADGSVKHYLHTWDDGYRVLLRCKKCGSLLLKQNSEFHSFGGDDSYYTDLFPVNSSEEALMYNEKYSGIELEREYVGRWIRSTDLNWSWSSRL